jgi:hypothetical protein
MGESIKRKICLCHLEAVLEISDFSFNYWNSSLLSCTVCIGIHLPWMELLLATALFFRTFPDARVSQREIMCDQDMEVKMFVLVSPKGRRCLVEASSNP